MIISLFNILIKELLKILLFVAREYIHSLQPTHERWCFISLFLLLYLPSKVKLARNRKFIVIL
jgi:hypothetical protein